MSNKWRGIQLFSGNTTGDSKYCKNTIITSRYTLITFFPNVIIQQFRKSFNIFFLTLIILQYALNSPTDPRTFTIVFSIIMIITIMKQAYEDLGRHKADDSVNNRIFFVFDKVKTIFIPQKARKLQVGQLIRLKEDDHVPCDLLLLRAIEKSTKNVSKCEITTANLDGEPNTKVRYSPLGLSKLESGMDEVDFVTSLYQQQLQVEYDQPNPDLYKFYGVIRSKSIFQNPVSITMENVLLRGTTVKNTQYIYGCILYTGKETRLSQNTLKVKRDKFSVVDHSINKIIIILFIAFTIFVGSALGLFLLQRDYINNSWYIPFEDQNEFGMIVTTFFIFLVYLSYMIPISLEATMESQKIGSSLLFGWDSDMECPLTGERAKCNTSDVNAELGQIDYFLTDKTGTLTQNNLNFVCCSIGTRRFDYNLNPNLNQYQLVELNQSGTRTEESFVIGESEVTAYLEAIALCHTVTAVSIDKSNNNDEDIVKECQIHYQGSSSDEEVLVTAMQTLGVTYMGDDNDGKNIIKQNGNLHSFTRHFVLDFDSDRKCMSVIVEDNEKRYFLITKGAESSVFSKCVARTPSELLQVSMSHVDEFAKRGYRTLVIAKKEITASELTHIQNDIEQHRRNPDGLQGFYNEIESGLTLLGTTGVEDQLQENVPQTLAKLKAAGIRIWMLTGDKMETAVNIGATCGIISMDSLQQHNYLQQKSIKEVASTTTIGYLTDATSPQMVLEKLVNCNKEKMSPAYESTLVVDGASFAFAFERHRELLAKVALESSQVIFCRMAPLQKAQVVRLIKSTKTGKNVRVCAVGDGGNDVAMIQEAHVGIGILGREGRQAARVADFAVPQFQHLQKAILVHGVWFYYRLTTMMAHILYRCFILVIPQFFYGFDSGFSGQPIYDTTFKVFYNIFFTSLPVLVFGILEQQKSSKELLQNFTTYKKYRGNSLLDLKNLIWWIFLFTWHTFLVVYFPRLVLSDVITHFDLGMYSQLLNSLIVTIPLLKVFTSAVYVNWILVASLAFSFISYLTYSLLTAEIIKYPWGGALQFAYFPLLSSPEVWFALTLTLVLSMLPDLVIGGFRRLDYLCQRDNVKSQL